MTPPLRQTSPLTEGHLSLPNSEEKPLKIADHGTDAFRYGIMGLCAWWRTWITAPVELNLSAAA